MEFTIKVIHHKARNQSINCWTWFITFSGSLDFHLHSFIYRWIVNVYMISGTENQWIVLLQHKMRNVKLYYFFDLKLYFHYKLMMSSTVHESALQSFKLLVICIYCIAFSYTSNKWHQMEINLCAEHGMMRA